MNANQISNLLTEGTILEGPHWTEPVRVLTAKVRGNRVEVQAVGVNTKRLWNKLLNAEEFDSVIKLTLAGELAALDGNPTHFRLAAEAHRIRLAYQYDPHFAVSVSQVDPLPHQMAAVYGHLLTQPRIRLLIADDPGAGKTIMGGLGIKELKFRGLIERTLIVTPANLTDQWRRELHEKFGEVFTVVNRATVSAAYGKNIWEDNPQCITSIDFIARQDDILNHLRDVRWDLVIVDEAHKMAVRSELVKHTGSGNVYHSVVDSDISGSTAKAPQIDRQLGSEYAKESVSEKLARSIFMYSFSGSQQRGATLPQLRLGVLNPEMAPPFIADALDRMTKRLWYLYNDSGLYRFDSRPNLNRILVDREEMVRSEPDKIKDFARTTLNDLIGDATFRVYRYPQEDRDVSDEPRLSLVVLDLHQVVAEDSIPEETEQFVTGILKQCGKGFRKNSNVLVFLAPDQDQASGIIETARRLLALRNIDADKTTKKQLNEEQLKDLADRLKEAEARLPSALTTAYRHILVPAEKKTLRPFDMGIGTFSGRTTLSSKVLEKLSVEQQILDKLDPNIMIGPRFGLWPDNLELIKVKTLADYFTQLTHLPRLLNDKVLPESLAQGVHRALFGYALGDGEKRQFDTIYYNDKGVTASDCAIIDSACLLRPAVAKALMPEPKTPEITVPGGGGGQTGPEVISGGGVAGGGGGEEEWKPGGGPVKIVEGERRLNKVRIKMDNLPWENWNDIYNEVIDPLAQEGAEVRCDVIVIAKGDAAIRENTVELGIKESLGQRGIQADIQTG